MSDDADFQQGANLIQGPYAQQEYCYAKYLITNRIAQLVAIQPQSVAWIAD